MPDAAATLRARAIRIRAVPTSGMIAANRAVKAIAEAEARREAPRGIKGRGRKGRRIKLRARDDITTAGTTTRGVIKGTPIGPWVLLDSGAVPHLVGAPKGRGRRRGKVIYLKAPGAAHPVRGPVAHPGARGTHLWARTRRRAEVVVPAIFDDAVAEALGG